MRSGLLRFVLGFALLVGALWTAGWYLAAGQITTRLAAWIEARRAEGLVVEHAGARVDGFPGPWRLRIAQPVLAGAGPTGWTWQGEALEARVSPWALREIDVSFPGEHQVSAGSGARLPGPWRVRAAKPDGRVVLGPDGRLQRLEIDFADAEVTRLPDFAPVRLSRAVAAVDIRSTADADHQDETLVLALALDGLSPVVPPVAALGTRIETVRLDAAFKGRLPPGRLRDAVAQWRDDGGTIDVNHARVEWGPVKAEGSGTLALDEANRPLGAFTTRWRGYAETIDALQVAGQLRPWEAAGAKMLLNALARQQPDGASQIDLPLTAQDGRLFVAGVPLLRLAPLRLD